MIGQVILQPFKESEDKKQYKRLKFRMTIEQIIQALNEYVPYSEDDPKNDNGIFLSNLMEMWSHTIGKEKGMTAIFNLMERHPHTDFGSPDPLVHALEAAGAGSYEGELLRSLMRKPTPLTFWMYNRIINQENDTRIIEGHIQRLRLFSKHPLVDSETKTVAERFIKFQQERL